MPFISYRLRKVRNATAGREHPGCYHRQIARSGAAVIYRTYIPRPPLSEFVQQFWYLQDYNVPHRRERVLPNASIQLIFDLRHNRIPVFTGADRDCESSVPAAIVAGVSSEYSIIDTTSLESIIGVHFKPGGAFPFLQIPAEETLNVDLPLNVVWGSMAETLRERLIETEGVADRFAILEGTLLDRVAGDLEPDRALQFAVSQFQTVPQVRSVADVARATGLNAKRLIRTFREHVGVTPKLFCRIRRFQDALERTASRKHVAWAELAADCGYFDQSHFVRDFQAFSGINPTDYLLNRGSWVNHVPVD